MKSEFGSQLQVTDGVQAGTEVVMADGSTTVTVIVTGVSQTEVCGVRDFALNLEPHLRVLGYDVRVVWLDAIGGSTIGCRPVHEVVAKASDAQIIVFNYSVFACAWHGIPVLGPSLAWDLWRAKSGVVLVAHEMAYPWKRRGWRGLIHAVTQRLALLPLVAASTVVVVTTESRRGWLQSRTWLPFRPTLFAPVFSNVTVRGVRAQRSDSLPVGIFGYGHETERRGLVVQAVAYAASKLEGVELVLIGAPGPESAQGFAWQEAAQAAGCPYRFTGVLAPDELSHELSGLAAFVCFDDAGPSSRKTTLAAALAHGVPTIALEGPDCWEDIVTSMAVELVKPDVAALTEALLGLLTDSSRAEKLRTAGRDFYESSMAAEAVAARYAEAIQMALKGRSRRSRLRDEATLPRLMATN